MADIVNVDSSSFDKLKRRIVKFLRMGRSDNRECIQIAPFGTDSNPIKGMKAVYIKTSLNGDSFLIGYLNVDQLAAPGEHRTYSTDADGNLKSYVWLHDDGTADILGNTDNMVRFSEMKKAFDKLRGDHNDLVNAFNSHMHATAGSGAPSPPTPGNGVPASPSDADISAAKIEEIKTL